MTVEYFQIDAFSDQAFSGNPAGVCPLLGWLPEETMQAMAEENHLSETAFFHPADQPGEFHLRWFTPTAEVDLCGHATLASAHCLYQELGETQSQLVFHTRSGPLTVKQTPAGYEMDFPAQRVRPYPLSVDWYQILGVPGEHIGAAADVLVRVESEALLRDMQPDLAAIAKLPARGLIVTAPAILPEIDFVSRFFAPKFGVPEDPVTGSSHCTLAPYWAEEMQKSQFRAAQVGPRGGELLIRLEGDRVFLTGKAVTVIKGTFYLPQAS